MSRRTQRRIAAILTATGVGLLAGGLPLGAAAQGTSADGDVAVINTETISVYTDVTGRVKSSRIYEQLALTGTGAVDLRNPIEAADLRNLDGFAGFDVVDGRQIVKTDVDGDKRLRTVSTYAGRLPITITATYLLDGKVVAPGDIVGESGELQVRYKVKNVTAVEQEVTIDDGTGGTVSRTVSVPIPLVGQLTTVAPPSFTNVASDAASLAGDGKGGTAISFTMTLFPPVGKDTAEFGYTARISDGVVPRAAVKVLPVNPLQSPTFKTAATAYKGGSESGIELANGAGEIDTNLLKLRDGAGDLLAGLIKLRNGSEQLSNGLTGKAAPGSKELSEGAGRLSGGLGQIDTGARKLMTGAGRLSGGLGQIDTGASKLADGAGRLSAGTSAAASGSRQLTDGLGQISGGLSKLADGLPKAATGILGLRDGVDLIIAGFGSGSDPNTLIGGLAALESGLGQLKSGADTIAGGLPNAKVGVDQVKSGLDAAIADGGSMDQLVGGLNSLLGLASCSADPVCAGTVQQLRAGATQSKANLTAAAAGLGQVSSGLATAIAGVVTIADKLGDARAGAAKLKAGAGRLNAGAQQVRDGLTQVHVGVSGAVAGVFQLNDGAAAAHSGSSSLTAGLGKLDAGAGRLADGTGQLAAGTADAATGSKKLTNGAGQLAAGTAEAAIGSKKLAAGAGTLADGLATAADGSDQLAEGLGKAADGAPKIVDGASRLSAEGTSKLADAGKETATDFGERYAVLEAAAERADTERMAYGAPQGAIGQMAYSFEIEGLTGQPARNVVQGLAGLGLLAVAIGILAVRRRFTRT